MIFAPLAGRVLADALTTLHDNAADSFQYRDLANTRADDPPLAQLQAHDAMPSCSDREGDPA